jgi:hypothetical protein
MSEKFEEFLLLLGSITKPCNFHDNLNISPELDVQQMNNFYYEREWRSIYEWKFGPEDVAMIIIKTPEMIETLHDQIDQCNLKVQKTVPILSFDMTFKI